MSDGEIDRRGHRSYPFNGRDKIAQSAKLLMRLKAAGYARENIPGYLPRNDDRKAATLAGPEGLLIPCRDSAGRIVALKVRRDSTADGQSRYCYVSSAKHGGAGPGAPPHVSLGVAAPVDLVRLTEGELKSDVATALSGVPTIGAGAGVASWRACLPVLRELGAKTVRVAFDGDARTNKTVAAALLACVEALPDEGFAVELERWPDQYKGIDDALAAGVTPEVLAGDAALAAAKEIAAAAGVHAAGPATKTIIVDGIGEMGLTVEAAGSKPQRKVSAKIGDVSHTDRLDVASAARRKQFAKRLAELLNAPALLDALRAALDSALPNTMAVFSLICATKLGASLKFRPPAGR